MSTLTIEQYFGRWMVHNDVTQERYDNAVELVRRVNEFIAEAPPALIRENPATRSIISGNHYGGFRTLACTVGAPKSHHKQGRAVDIFDPDNRLDDWCFKNEALLEKHKLWMEHPDATKGWAHFQTQPPGSGKRFYFP